MDSKGLSASCPSSSVPKQPEQTSRSMCHSNAVVTNGAYVRSDLREALRNAVQHP